MGKVPTQEKGFWRLLHEDLRTLLQRQGLSWECARVFLALGDLTWGRGKTQAVISLGRIAGFSGVPREHIPRAIDRLRELGLYGEQRLSDRVVERWVIWPGKAEGVAKTGNTPASQGVTGTGDIGVAKAGSESVSEAGDTLKKKKLKTPRLAAGKGGHQQFVEWFCDEYEWRTGLAYSFQGGKDGKAVKELVKKYTLDELRAMTAAMFGDTWGRENASPAILWGQRNKWRQKALPAGETQAGRIEKQRLVELQEIVNGD